MGEGQCTPRLDGRDGWVVSVNSAFTVSVKRKRSHLSFFFLPGVSSHSLRAHTFLNHVQGQSCDLPDRVVIDCGRRRRSRSGSRRRGGTWYCIRRRRYVAGIQQLRRDRLPFVLCGGSGWLKRARHLCGSWSGRGSCDRRSWSRNANVIRVRREGSTAQRAAGSVLGAKYGLVAGCAEGVSAGRRHGRTGHQVLEAHGARKFGRIGQIRRSGHGAAAKCGERKKDKKEESVGTHTGKSVATYNQGVGFQINFSNCVEGCLGVV